MISMAGSHLDCILPSISSTNCSIPMDLLHGWLCGALKSNILSVPFAKLNVPVCPYPGSHFLQQPCIPVSLTLTSLLSIISTALAKCIVIKYLSSADSSTKKQWYDSQSRRWLFVINIHSTLNIFKCWKPQKPLFQLLIMCSLFSAWLIFRHNTILRKHTHSLMFSLGARNVCCSVFVQVKEKCML